MAMVEVSVVPVGTETPSVSRYVARAVQLLQEERDIKYELTAMGTIIEGDLDYLLALVLHPSVLELGQHDLGPRGMSVGRDALDLCVKGITVGIDEVRLGWGVHDHVPGLAREGEARIDELRPRGHEEGGQVGVVSLGKEVGADGLRAVL